MGIVLTKGGVGMRIVNADGRTADVDIFFDKKSSGGRPRKVLTEEAVKLIESLARIMCTEEEIAACLSVNPLTFHTEDNDAVFKEAIKRGYSQGKQSLRREQWKLAQKGNASMLIWLGKQWLGQTERQEVSFTENNKLQVMSDYIGDIKNGKTKDIGRKDSTN